MRRREVITLLGGAATLPFAAHAQQKSMPVVGFLGSGPPDLNGPNESAFRQGLAGLGSVEGRNILIEYRWAEGKPERFPVLAAELVARKVDVILTAGGTLAALAAKQATTTLPIVFGVVGDPIAEGLVASLARPGGNVTGLSNVTNDLIGKWLELLKQVVPGVSQRTCQRGQAEGSKRLGAGVGGAASNRRSARSGRLRQGIPGHIGEGCECSGCADNTSIRHWATTHCGLGGKEPVADGVRKQELCRCRRSDVVWTELR